MTMLYMQSGLYTATHVKIGFPNIAHIFTRFSFTLISNECILVKNIYLFISLYEQKKNTCVFCLLNKYVK